MRRSQGTEALEIVGIHSHELDAHAATFFGVADFARGAQACFRQVKRQIDQAIDGKWRGGLDIASVQRKIGDFTGDSGRFFGASYVSFDAALLARKAAALHRFPLDTSAPRNRPTRRGKK